MNVVSLIPARGGSKAIPKKNIAPFAGRPLIAHTIGASLGAARISRTFVSTDCPEIADCSRQHGAEVPYLRPAELAGDETPMIPVLLHFLDYLVRETGGEPEALVLLQPTSPLRTKETIDRAVAVFFEKGADSLVTVVEVPHAFTPVSLLNLDASGRVGAAFPELGQSTRRQDKPRFYSRSGPAVLVIKPEILRAGRLYTENTFALVINPVESWDIDTLTDLRIAEALAALQPNQTHAATE